MIQEGDQLIIRKDKNMKSIQLRKNRKVWMEKMTFTMDNVVGMPYGTTFQVKNGRMVKVEKETKIEEEPSKEEASDADKQDNRNLQDLNENQKLGRDDIETLKSEGVHGEVIIDQLIEHSATFKEKTEYSKEKYIKKKKKKHMPFYTILRPTTRLVAEMYYNRSPGKICYMRIDTLAQMMTQANVRSGSRVLLFENCSGLVLAAIMEKLGGCGEIVQIFNGDLANRTALESYNFPKNYQKMLRAFPLDQVNSLVKNSTDDVDTKIESEHADTCDSEEEESVPKHIKLDKDYDNISEHDDSSKNNQKSKVNDSSICTDKVESARPEEEIKEEEKTKPETMEGISSDPLTEKIDVIVEESANDLVRDKAETSKDKQEIVDCNSNDSVHESKSDEIPVKTSKDVKPDTVIEESTPGMKRKLSNREKKKERKKRHYHRSRQLIQKGDMDCLIVACKFHPTSLVMKLLDFVAPSRPFAIYCQYKEPLMDCYLQIKQTLRAVQVNLTETWLRQYQVLPERTHPTVNMSGTGGYLLTGITVEQ